MDYPHWLLHGLLISICLNVGVQEMLLCSLAGDNNLAGAAPTRSPGLMLELVLIFCVLKVARSDVREVKRWLISNRRTKVGEFHSYDDPVSCINWPPPPPPTHPGSNLVKVSWGKWYRRATRFTRDSLQWASQFIEYIDSQLRGASIPGGLVHLLGVREEQGSDGPFSRDRC